MQGAIGAEPLLLRGRGCPYRARVTSRGGEPFDVRSSVVRAGQQRVVLRDLYADLLAMRWRYLIALFAAVYVIVNGVFAAAYVFSGDCIVGAVRGSFLEAFFFSIETLSTIGYGVMSPRGLCGHAIVGVESLAGVLGFAVITGLVFAKFARPSAGVVFSRHAIVGVRNGVPHLMFRVANERGSEIMQAALHVAALMDEVTPEGQRMRRFYDLRLERSATPVLIMSWLVMHRIDETSSLHGKTEQDFVRGDIRITASLTGVDSTFMQTVHTYHQYRPQDIVRDAEFEDVISRLPDGRFQLDLSKFDQLKPRA